MCGICGELSFNGTRPEQGTLDRMLSRLKERGPDASGHYLSGPIALGHRRLSVIDLSERANQPMVDEQLGLVLVFNGTIYNYRELREQLINRGYSFFSESDSEVILKAFAEWGEDCPVRLHGMFAFAIWDTQKQTLFLARDRFGIKPLYYSQTPAGVRFASTSQALLAAGIQNKDIDSVALHHHMTLHGVVPAPRTLLRGLRKVPPAHSCTWTPAGQHKLVRYWRLKAAAQQPSLSEWEWIEAVHESLKKAIEKRRVIADVPVGVLLSGGLDSSLLVALLAEAGQDQLHTFSVGFECQPEEMGNEFEYSDLVVKAFGTRHEKITIPDTEILRRIPEAVQHMSEPMLSQDAIAFYLLGEQVAKNIKVVQSGQGADEVFGGYFWYPKMQQAQGSDIDRFRDHYFDRTHDEYLSMVKAPFHGSDYTSSYVEAELAATGADHFLNRVLAFDATTLIVDDPIKRVDNMTMAWGLEARVPFLDHELVELAIAMPPEIKLKGDGKHPLKLIARDLLPDQIIDRPKGYFPVPALKYVRGQVLDFVRDILDSTACKQRGLYERSYVDMLLAAPERHHTRIHGSKIWHLALLELWLQQNVDPA